VEADRFSGRRNRKVLKRGEAARTPIGSSSAMLIAEWSPPPGAIVRRPSMCWGYGTIKRANWYSEVRQLTDEGYPGAKQKRVK
jgi:hypothetical protein